MSRGRGILSCDTPWAWETSYPGIYRGQSLTAFRGIGSTIGELFAYASKVWYLVVFGLPLGVHAIDCARNELVNSRDDGAHALDTILLSIARSDAMIAAALELIVDFEGLKAHLGSLCCLC
ncbi:hypothetical protein ColLi_00502 [Colletotrichum liriopes]|uniref:Uncharacterized protein n=1 Tax=Colletotrichum liriopes TaxID=708192 RepID=A0AA37LM16_9PEZI|nr:hypothetical protein ColLi_00502 [Colletotrichum liriopes]